VNSVAFEPAVYNSGFRRVLVTTSGQIDAFSETVRPPERYRNVITTLQAIRVSNVDDRRWEEYTNARERCGVARRVGPNAQF